MNHLKNQQLERCVFCANKVMPNCIRGPLACTWTNGSGGRYGSPSGWMCSVCLNADVKKHELSNRLFVGQIKHMGVVAGYLILFGAILIFGLVGLIWILSVN